MSLWLEHLSHAETTPPSEGSAEAGILEGERARDRSRNQYEAFHFKIWREKVGWKGLTMDVPLEAIPWTARASTHARWK
jgi:hypothetical protein